MGQYRDQAGRTHGFLLEDGTFVSIDFPGASASTGKDRGYLLER